MGLDGGERSSSPTREADKINALAGLEFKQNLPVLQDSDPDFEAHWLVFSVYP